MKNSIEDDDNNDNNINLNQLELEDEDEKLRGQGGQDEETQAKLLKGNQVKNIFLKSFDSSASVSTNETSTQNHIMRNTIVVSPNFNEKRSKANYKNY